MVTAATKSDATRCQPEALKPDCDPRLYKPMDWEAETVKIARLRQMRLAKRSRMPWKKRRGVITIPIRVADADAD
jgi:hypothetical protein